MLRHQRAGWVCYSTRCDGTVGFFYRVSMWLNAVNAMLTWVKVFKFLDYFPNLKILTVTLGYAMRPLAWFMVVLVIVLTGLSQGFHIAFGFDVDGARLGRHSHSPRNRTSRALLVHR